MSFHIGITIGITIIISIASPHRRKYTSADRKEALAHDMVGCKN